MGSSSPNTKFPWVFGLRPHLADNDWKKILALLLLGKFSDIKKGVKTIESEKGLGIPASWYWYISRMYEAYGFVISFSHATTSEWTEEERGISPFDSGAIWHNHLSTTPMLKDDSQKVGFFRKYDKKLLSWDKTVQSYVVSNYDSFSDYIDGHQPKTGVAEIVKKPDDSQSWAWEAHVKLNSFDEKIVIFKIFIDYENKDRFLEWIEDYGDFELFEKELLFERMESEYCVACINTEPSSSTPFQAARNNLLAISI